MKKLNYEHCFQINIKRELIKMSLMKIMKTVLAKVLFFRPKILTFIKMFNEIKLFNEIMIYGNKKAVKAFIKLDKKFSKLFLNEDFVKMLKAN